MTLEKSILTALRDYTYVAAGAVAASAAATVTMILLLLIFLGKLLFSKPNYIICLLYTSDAADE